MSLNDNVPNSVARPVVTACDHSALRNSRACDSHYSSKATSVLPYSPAAPNAASSLRDALRQQLSGPHDTIDIAFSRLDLTSDADYRIFLGAHYGALCRMAKAMTHQPETAGTTLLATLLAALEDDMRDLGGQTTVPDDQPAPLHPLAFEYILFGSRLGNQVLAKRRRNALAAQGRSETANRYLGHPFDPRLWQTFLHQTTNISVEHPLVECIISDAERCFEWFSSALSQQISRPLATEHPLRAEKAPL